MKNMICDHAHNCIYVGECDHKYAHEKKLGCYSNCRLYTEPVKCIEIKTLFEVLENGDIKQ